MKVPVGCFGDSWAHHLVSDGYILPAMTKLTRKINIYKRIKDGLYSCITLRAVLLNPETSMKSSSVIYSHYIIIKYEAFL